MDCSKKQKKNSAEGYSLKRPSKHTSYLFHYGRCLSAINFPHNPQKV